MSTLIDYQELSETLQTYFEQYPAFDPNQANAQTLALLERCRTALSQYAQDLEEAHAQAEEARQAFQRNLAAAQQQQAAPLDPTVPPNPAAPPVTEAPTTTTYRSEKLSDPAIFRGDQDRTRLHLFKQQMRIKLLGNADRFPTLQSKLSYAFGRLEDIAASQFLAFTTDEGINLPSMERFYEILDTAFGDPDRVYTARRSLRDMRQRNRTFSDYFAEFQRYASESGFDEITRVECLLEGISTELMEALVHHETPTTVDGCATLLQRVDNRQRAIKARLGKRHPFTTSNSIPVAQRTVPAPAQPLRPYVPAPTPANQTSPAPTHPSFAPGGDTPMELSGGRRRPTPTERNARLTEGRCFYCGGVGHLVRNCPQARGQGGGQRKYTMRGAAIRVEEGQDSDDESAKDLSLA